MNIATVKQMYLLRGINWLNEVINGLLDSNISLPAMDPSGVHFFPSPIMLAFVCAHHWILGERILNFIPSYYDLL